MIPGILLTTPLTSGPATNVLAHWSVFTDLDTEGQRVYELLTSPGNGYENGWLGRLGIWICSPELVEGDLMQR